MDFVRVSERPSKKGVTQIFPSFIVKKSKDLMIRGGKFYSVWDEEAGLWSMDEYDVQRLVDVEMQEYGDDVRKRVGDGVAVEVQNLSNFTNGHWKTFRTYISNLGDNYRQLDDSITFADAKVSKGDYISRKLDYSLSDGRADSYEEIMSTLYDPEERVKLEWAIGSILSGDSKKIQKFIVLYGDSGTGKSTFLDILQKLTDGYYVMFEAKSLTSGNNQFALEMFKSNPLVAIQHDGDLSKIEDNTLLNSLVSHEKMSINEKFKSKYEITPKAFLFMGTNKPVKISDSKSGIIRRLIDVRPSLRLIPTKRYHNLVKQIDFELGAIASHCLAVYKEMGKDYYSGYKPMGMMFETDIFFNFVEANEYEFRTAEYVCLKQAYTMYKEFCEESSIQHILPLYKFREELKSYFSEYSDIKRVDGKQVRSVYEKFKKSKLTQNHKKEKGEVEEASLSLTSRKSLLDEALGSCKAQYASEEGIPINRWAKVQTVLSELETGKLHYVQPPKNHIVIDFDLKNEKGEKDKERNLIEAAKWPKTYAEMSKGGNGVHLHYIYDGDVSELAPLYAEDIEIKVFKGYASLRRMVSKCNEEPVATISGGLPLKEKKKSVVNNDVVRSEKGLRAQIEKNLRKEVHPGTKPSVDFIKKILDDAYESGLKYDVTDMRPDILAFANGSTNQALKAVKTVLEMKFASEEISENKENYGDKPLVFYDVEVFPNLFVVVYKEEGDKKPVKMINPSSNDIGRLLEMKLVGFNCRRYDNHILYARYIGYDLESLYDLSQKIISGSRNSMFGEAYNISYADVYDFSSKKQSLKKFEIELGIHHQELGLPWDKPVDESMWEKVADYCVNDVIATEATFNDYGRKQDYVARQILSDLSGLTVNDTTQMHTARIIFGQDKEPQKKFNYVNLSDMFPGYVYERGKSTYRDEEVGEGGYVYAEPGMYYNVAVLDVASMHPTSLVAMNHFGPYTKNFEDLLKARVAIKHKDYASAKKMLGGVLAKYLDTPENAKALSYALKIVINIVYGLTSATFDSKFKDPRNIDNIVAKRGALFMIDLKHAVQEKGFQVIHIKTDSIKIPNATPDIINFVMEFGKKYGYSFDYEDLYRSFCLVNKAVYIASISDDSPSVKSGEKAAGHWEATGAQFAEPYVYKTLFSKEPVEISDLLQTKEVKVGSMVINFGKEPYHFVGRVGSFLPVVEGAGGGTLLRESEGKHFAVTATKGYLWMEGEQVIKLGLQDKIDMRYYNGFVNKALEDISKFGPYEDLVDTPPWEEN